MKKRSLIFLILFYIPVFLSATNGEGTKKHTQAIKTSEPIKIDGVLDEAIWMSAPIATDFTQLEPQPGFKPNQATEVKVIYDNTGIYIAAILHESSIDSIAKELSERDNLGNTDWFGVFIDPYQDGLNGFEFIITPSDVQFDAKASAQDEDENWDAVWESKTKILEDRWIAEIKIPYSAIRFPDKEEQSWHINFGRNTHRSQEKVFWSEINPKVDGFLNQSGIIKGINGIKSPMRLSATPFLAVYGLHYNDGNGDNSFGRSFNAGMDVKYGLSDAFTLDMTLIPDFGEAQSDNEVLNLSPFEVRHDENRQFFTEGTELFNKGGLFYSRRVGGRPLHYSDVSDQLNEGEEVLENPEESQLYNATKISGRTNNGLGIGFFNATAGRQTALISTGDNETREYETAPLTNYNVIVLDQNLKNNSSVSFINASVLRNGSDYDANVTGALFSLKNKSKTYGINGGAGISQKYIPGANEFGHIASLEVEKISGNFSWFVEYLEKSDTWDPNDLGFDYNNNEREVEVGARYFKYEAFGPFNEAGGGMSIDYSRLYRPDTYTNFGIENWFFGETKNFWRLNIFMHVQPFSSYDYFEPRMDGRYYRLPANNYSGFYVGTDRRKKLQFRFNGGFGNVAEKGRNNWRLSIRPSFRVNEKLTFSAEVENSKLNNEVGFVTHLDQGDHTDIIFAHRDRFTVENSFSTQYSFNNKMALSLRLRHYWSKVEHNEFHLLLEDGNLGETDYTGTSDFNFDAFNIDMVYRWRFAPGSDIYVVWKNSIFSHDESAPDNYFDNIGTLFENPKSNSLSLKIIYYLDYLSLMKKN